MIAETAYNVIQSLPQEELFRLFALLNVSPLNAIEKPKRKPKNQSTIWTIQDVKDKLLATHFKPNKKR
jgi:hypothetical protein